MTVSDRLPPDRAVRLLRAKVGELETIVLDNEHDAHPGVCAIDLAADISLVADILASHIEDMDRYMHKISEVLVLIGEFSGMTIEAFNGLYETG